jgi:hypothetical protein
MTTAASEGSKRPSNTRALVVTAMLGVAFAAALPLLRSQRAAYLAEAEVLRAARSSARATLDSLQLIQQATLDTLALERARAGARSIAQLHLVVAVDSGTVALMRDGIVLRSMPAQFRGAKPTRGTQLIARITTSRAAASAAPTVDSLGNTIAAPVAEVVVDRIVLDDGTVLEGGDAAAAFLGGTVVAAGARTIVVSRRDFDAVRPNLVRGMPTVVF